MQLDAPQARKVVLARRKVKNYFLNASRLYESKYVKKKFLTEVTSVDGRKIFYDIVEDLERALNPDYDKSRFDRVRSLCGKARSKDLIPPVPTT